MTNEVLDLTKEAKDALTLKGKIPQLIYDRAGAYCNKSKEGFYGVCSLSRGHKESFHIAHATNDAVIVAWGNELGKHELLAFNAPSTKVQCVFCAGEAEVRPGSVTCKANETHKATIAHGSTLHDPLLE